MRFYPTKEQEEIINKTFGCVRFVYNSVLRWRMDAYYNDGVSVGYLESSKCIQVLKQDNPWLGEVSFVALQQSVRNQQSAYKNFFDKRAGYPKFKKKKNRQSFRLVGTAVRWDGNNLRIPKTDVPLKIRWSYDKPESISSLTISRDPSGRYFVSLTTEFEPDVLPPTDSMIGVDLGVKDVIATSDGYKSGALKLTKKHENKLAYLQRKLSKKQKGSSNYHKLNKKIAKLHAKIADTRKDFLHKISRKLVNENQVIAFEDLNVRGMMQNRKLSKAIGDIGMYELKRQVQYKSEWAGRTFVEIDRFFPSSKRMSCCGHVLDKLSLSERTVVCPECGEIHDRDTNAARNILAAGLAVIKVSGATGTGMGTSREGVLNEESLL